MEEKIITFEEALNLSKVAKKNLFLGNGFSINFSKNFDYKKLSEKIDTIEPINNVKPIFDKLKTDNFEEVLFKLNQVLKAEEVLKIYSQSVDIEDIKKDYEAIKSELIKIVSFVHPDLPQDIEKEYEKAKQFFINLFGNQKKYSLYTTNYDFILYWIIMKMKEEKLNMLSDDGFRQGRKEDKFVIWENDFDHQRNIWYLHGALHLFREDFYLKKNTYIRTGIPLKEQTKKALEYEKEPIFISEGTPEQKKITISKNPYLHRGLLSLQKISGCLFLFGWSASGQDKHIIDILIKNRQLKTLFIGVHGNLISEDLLNLANQFRSRKKKKENYPDNKLMNTDEYNNLKDTVYFYNTQGIIK